MRRLAVFLCLASLPATARAQDPATVEKLTEELAYALQDFSKGRAVDIAKHLAPEVRGRMVDPATLDRAPIRSKGIDRTLFVDEGKPQTYEASAFAKELSAIIHRYEYVEFQPVRSEMEDDLLSTIVAFNMIGKRTKNGHRAAVWGLCNLTVKHGRITSFVLRTGNTQKVTRDWFRNITPPEMKATDPAVLDHPTLGLAAYGAAAADVDGDGRVDILSTGHDTNRLYLNRGPGKPFEVKEVKSPRRATGPLFLDYDNDGDPDLFLSANGRQMLLENRKGEFVDVSAKAGVDMDSIGFSVAAGDINGDSFPDIYVTAYNNYGPVAPSSWDSATNGLPNLLFVSNGDGTYTEAAKKWKVAGNGWSYAAQFIDINGDGKLDLYVANDFGGGNPLYIHKGDHFVDEAKAWGIAESGYSMGVSFGDYDNDGDFDLHVTKMSSKAGNRILARLRGDRRVRALEPLADGNTVYENMGASFRVAWKIRAGWGWGGGFVDFDNDGLLDIYAPAGFLSGASQRDT